MFEKISKKQEKVQKKIQKQQKLNDDKSRELTDEELEKIVDGMKAYVALLKAQAKAQRRNAQG